MAERALNPRLADILEAIEVINAEMAEVTLAEFEADKRKRWLVERGIEIISEATRHLGDELKGRHPGIAWQKVAGIGNILRHEYHRIAHDVLWHVIRNDLPTLEQVCREEFALDGAKEQD